MWYTDNMKTFPENAIASFLISIPYAVFVVLTIEPFFIFRNVSEPLQYITEALLPVIYLPAFKISNVFLLGHQDKMPTDTWYEWLALGFAAACVAFVVIFAVITFTEKIVGRSRK